MLRPDRELYLDEYRGISIEVSRHWRHVDADRNPEGIWCFYLHLAVEQFHPEFHEDLCRPKKVMDYGSQLQPYAECLNGLEWHGGMTFYEVTRTPEPFRQIKAGCDYNHIWDEGASYSAERVMADARKCVDSLWLTHPNIKTVAELWKDHYRPFNEAMAAKKANDKLPGGSP